jgi:uncharacterized membrane protein
MGMSSNGSTSKPLQSLSQANVHEVEDVINIDDIVDYFVMQHDVTSHDDVANVKGYEAVSNDALLAYMAGQNTGASPGNIRHSLHPTQPLPPVKQHHVRSMQVLPLPELFKSAIPRII